MKGSSVSGVLLLSLGLVGALLASDLHAAAQPPAPKPAALPAVADAASGLNWVLPVTRGAGAGGRRT